MLAIELGKVVLESVRSIVRLCLTESVPLEGALLSLHHGGLEEALHERGLEIEESGHVVEVLLALDAVHDADLVGWSGGTAPVRSDEPDGAREVSVRVLEEGSSERAITLPELLNHIHVRRLFSRRGRPHALCHLGPSVDSAHSMGSNLQILRHRRRLIRLVVVDVLTGPSASVSQIFLMPFDAPFSFSSVEGVVSEKVQRESSFLTTLRTKDTMNMVEGGGFNKTRRDETRNASHFPPLGDPFWLTVFVGLPASGGGEGTRSK